MTKFIELINRFAEMEGSPEENREKLYIKEAILLEAVPKKYKEEYCRDRNYIITDNPDTLINWLREVDKRRKKRSKITMETTDVCDVETTMNRLKYAAMDKTYVSTRYRLTVIIEEL